VRPLAEKVIVRQFAPAHNGILAGDYTAHASRETGNDLELKREAVETSLHRITEVHNFLEIWHGSQNVPATQKQSRSQNKQMIAIEYISDTEDMIEASWSNIQHDGAAAFKLSERSPLPPSLSPKDHFGGQTHELILRWVKRINRHPAKSDEDSGLETIVHTEICLYQNGAMDNPNATDDDCEADIESDMELNNCIENPECPARRDVSVAANVPGLRRPTYSSMKKAEQGLRTVTAMETSRSKGNKKKSDRMGHYVFTRFYMLLDQEIHVVKYHRRLVSSPMWILLDKPKYSRQNESFRRPNKI